MRLGLIARADNSGLGIQTHEFYRHMKPDKTIVVDISALNGNAIYPERYPDAKIIKGFPTLADYEEFLKDLDVVFIAEASYARWFYNLARDKGVKTAVQYNYEFFDWFDPTMPRPDMFIAPSTWHFEDVDKLCQENNIKHIYLHCPVDREKLPYHPKEQARIFLHVAGRSAAHDRNGTETVIEASRFLQTPAKIKIHFQGEQGLPHQATHDYNYYRGYAHKLASNQLRIEMKDYPNYEDIYANGDVMILPRRYGGNCLPMNEALSTGMPVIMTDISPNNNFLPAAWLLPAQLVESFTPRTKVDIYEADPRELAKRIDEFYNLSEEAMAAESRLADSFASSIGWATMATQYRVALEALCRS